MTDLRRHKGADRSWWRIVVTSYGCPSCGAAPGELCITSSGRHTPEPHAERSRVAHDHHWRAAGDDELSDITRPICAGCGRAQLDGEQGWRMTDAAWCPDCAWLA